MAEADSVAHAVFFAVSLVPAAGGDFADQGPGDSAEPLQLRRAGGDAFGAVSVDHQLLCAPRSRREKRRTSRGEQPRNWRPLAYFGVLVVGGIALFVPGPWLASRAFHHDFTASFLIFTALVNIHHFILDGAIWKLRDGRIASLLLNSRERISDAAAEAGGQLAACRAMAGGQHCCRPFAARGYRAVAAGLGNGRSGSLLSGAAHRRLARSASGPRRLDSFDSSLQMRLAQRAMEDGQPQQAEAAWRRAMQANPADPAPRQALLRFLIDQNRFDEAFNLTDASLKYTPKDANLLVDRGFLALRRGHADQALASWDQALAVDSGPIARASVSRGRTGSRGQGTGCGVTLQRVSQKRLRGSRRRIVLRRTRSSPSCCAWRIARRVPRRRNWPLKSYHLAEKLAAQTGQRKLESVADVNEAALAGEGRQAD